MRETMNAWEVAAAIRAKAFKCAERAAKASRNKSAELDGQFWSSWVKQAREYEEQAQEIEGMAKKYAQEVQKIKAEKPGSGSEGGPGHSRNAAQA